MGKDICKFDLLLVTAGSACVDSIGMTIYTRCPNFKLHIAGNLTEAWNQTRLHTPDVFIIDEGMRKDPGFRNFQDSLERNKSIVFFVTGSEPTGRVMMGAAPAFTMAKTISAEDLQRRMVTVAEELFWRKMSAAGAVMPRVQSEGQEEP